MYTDIAQQSSHKLYIYIDKKQTKSGNKYLLLILLLMLLHLKTTFNITIILR